MINLIQLINCWLWKNVACMSQWCRASQPISACSAAEDVPTRYHMPILWLKTSIILYLSLSSLSYEWHTHIVYNASAERCAMHRCSKLDAFRDLYGRQVCRLAAACGVWARMNFTLLLWHIRSSIRIIEATAIKLFHDFMTFSRCWLTFCGMDTKLSLTFHYLAALLSILMRFKIWKQKQLPCKAIWRSVSQVHNYAALWLCLVSARW